MGMNENKKSKVWVYAVILFTSAFIVLLLTAYSQIKLNRNLIDYKSQVSSKESENKKVQQNFSSAQEMNVKLNDEIKKLQEENNALKESISNLENEKAGIEEKNNTENEAVDSLSNVINTYLNGFVVESAGMIDGINAANLEGKAAETYKKFSVKVKAEAGKILFDEGFQLYDSAKYIDAAAKLLLSSQYAQAEEYSDKCLYYLAYSELKIQDKALALEHMNKLIENYNDSKYLKSARRFVEKYK
jgi:cell division protein FtsB